MSTSTRKRFSFLFLMNFMGHYLLSHSVNVYLHPKYQMTHNPAYWFSTREMSIDLTTWQLAIERKKAIKAFCKVYIYHHFLQYINWRFELVCEKKKLIKRRFLNYSPILAIISDGDFAKSFQIFNNWNNMGWAA